jgi:hypothetical protein
MESIFEFFKSDQRLLYAVVFIVLLVLFYVLVRLFVGKSKDDYYDEDDLDEDDDQADRDGDEELEERFFRIPSYDLPEDWSETFEVIVDRETKVQYLCSTEGYGLTPLIDSEGKPILYKDKYEDQDEQRQEE